MQVQICVLVSSKHTDDGVGEAIRLLLLMMMSFSAA